MSEANHGLSLCVKSNKEVNTWILRLLGKLEPRKPLHKDQEFERWHGYENFMALDAGESEKESQP